MNMKVSSPLFKFGQTMSSGGGTLRSSTGPLLAAVSWIPLCFAAVGLLMDHYSKLCQGTGSNTSIKLFVVFNC